MTLAIRNNRRSLHSILCSIASEQSAPDDVRRAIRDAWHQGTVAVSSDDPCRVSYARSRSIRYNADRRTVVALSRFLSRHMPQDVERREYWIDRISNQYRSRIVDDSQFRVLTGYDIVDAYENEVGGHSCMSGDCANLVELYADNPGRVSLLVYGDTRGRAVVWNADCGTTLLDRCYADCDDVKRLMREYASRQGWTCRDGDQAGNNGWEGGARYVVSDLDVPGSLMVPWLDTLDRGQISECGRYLTVGMSHGECLRNQNGGPYHDCERCTKCACFISEDQERRNPHGDAMCQSCFDDYFIDCEQCCQTIEHHESVEIPSPRGRWTMDVCLECADDLAPRCAECDEHTRPDDLVSSSDGRYCVDCDENMGDDD